MVCSDDKWTYNPGFKLSSDLLVDLFHGSSQFHYSHESNKKGSISLLLANFSQNAASSLMLSFDKVIYRDFKQENLILSTELIM